MGLSRIITGPGLPHLHHIDQWQLHPTGEEPRDPSGLQLVQRERDNLPRKPDEGQARRIPRREQVFIQGRYPARTKPVGRRHNRTDITHQRLVAVQALWKMTPYALDKSMTGQSHSIQTCDAFRHEAEGSVNHRLRSGGNSAVSPGCVAG